MINIKNIKFNGNNISFDDNGNVNGIGQGKYLVIFDCPKYHIKNVKTYIKQDDELEIKNEVIAKAIANKWNVKELINILKNVDEFKGEINEYQENVVSPFYMDDIDTYEDIEKYYKGVWNNTFYEGGVAYFKLLNFIKNNLKLFKSD